MALSDKTQKLFDKFVEWDKRLIKKFQDKQIVQEFVDSIETKQIREIYWCGGEPLMWDMTLLTTGLKSKNKIIHIETSGAYKLTGNWDWICLSPKKRMKPLAEFYNVANELKVIVYNKDDLKFAEEQAKMVNSDAHLYLQPEWDNREKMMPIMVDYVKNNPKWKISLQTHKYLNIP